MENIRNMDEYSIELQDYSLNGLINDINHEIKHDTKLILND